MSTVDSYTSLILLFVSAQGGAADAEYVPRQGRSSVVTIKEDGYRDVRNQEPMIHMQQANTVDDHDEVVAECGASDNRVALLVTLINTSRFPA